MIRPLQKKFALLLRTQPPRHRHRLGAAPPAVRGFALPIHRHAIRSCLDFFNVLNTLLVFCPTLDESVAKLFCAAFTNAAASPPALASAGAARRARFCAAPAGAAHSPARNSEPRARFSSSCPPSKSRPSTDPYASIRACAGTLPAYIFCAGVSAALFDAVEKHVCAEKMRGGHDGFDTFARGNHQYIRAAPTRTDDAVADVGTAAMAIGGAGCVECCRGGAGLGAGHDAAA